MNKTASNFGARIQRGESWVYGLTNCAESRKWSSACLCLGHNIRLPVPAAGCMDLFKRQREKRESEIHTRWTSFWWAMRLYACVLCKWFFILWLLWFGIFSRNAPRQHPIFACVLLLFVLQTNQPGRTDDIKKDVRHSRSLSKVKAKIRTKRICQNGGPRYIGAEWKRRNFCQTECNQTGLLLTHTGSFFFVFGLFVGGFRLSCPWRPLLYAADMAMPSDFQRIFGKGVPVCVKY